VLGLGTGRAIAADASVTAIDILLKPDTTMTQHATATNDRLRKVFPKGFALDVEHCPHITLVQRFVLTENLDKVCRRRQSLRQHQCDRPGSWKLSNTITYRTKTLASRALSSNRLLNCSNWNTR